MVLTMLNPNPPIAHPALVPFLRLKRFWVGLPFLCLLLLAPGLRSRAADQPPPSRLPERWLFVWDDLTKPEALSRMIARFPRAAAAGYNGVAFSYNIAASQAAALREAARQNHLQLIAIVMGGAHDRNYTEGVPVRDALFVARGGMATLQPDNPTKLLNGDFEDVADQHFHGWTMQDDPAVTTFADHATVHGGQTSLRMQDMGRNPSGHCRLAQPIKLQPYRQYRISFWVKTEDLSPADAEVKVLTDDTTEMISFQSFHVDPTQDWQQYDLVFNSLGHEHGRL